MHSWQNVSGSRTQMRSLNYTMRLILIFIDTHCYILKDPHLSQDALQEIYVLTYKNISTLKTDRLIYSWMKQITYHVCCDFLRRTSNIPGMKPGIIRIGLMRGVYFLSR